ncbi:DUF6364 family protein [Goodfellowiella coeruleoviolacea]|uniref:DUF6364 family protein n=1 Tax=Goodfellowiella coeruleoviolacea TaxID=334858 RepID=UPI0020A51817|nr:DUF6364 family protein [Goodfellowiella coeruleoviolacea]
MTKRNITLQLDEEVIQQAKVLAARRGTSISGLLARQLTELTAADERYQRARAHALRSMDEAIERGGISWRREDLYER